MKWGGGGLGGVVIDCFEQPARIHGNKSCEKYGVHCKQNIRKQTDSFLFTK